MDTANMDTANMRELIQAKGDPRRHAEVRAKIRDAGLPHLAAELGRIANRPSDSRDRCGCGDQTAPLPLWGIVAVLATGAAVGIVLGVTNVPPGRVAIAAIATALAMTVGGRILSRLASPVHTHCDTCDRCSDSDGLPTRRTIRALDRTLITAGWTVRCDANLCRACSGSSATA